MNWKLSRSFPTQLPHFPSFLSNLGKNCQSAAEPSRVDQQIRPVRSLTKLDTVELPNGRDPKEHNIRMITSVGGKKVFESGTFSLKPVEHESFEQMTNQPGKSFLFTPQVAQEAFQSLEHKISAILSSDDSPRNALHVVILDPVAVMCKKSFEECILFEKSINKDAWDIDLETLARKKALVPYKCQQDSFYIQKEMPWFYQEGDNKYGGAVCSKGIIVSCAGIAEKDDHQFSEWIAESCQELVKKKMEVLMNDSNKHFIS